MCIERIDRQIRFIMEIDKLKEVYRQSYTSSGLRPENDAEHSWHLALMAMCLQEHLGEADLLKVLRLVLIHDLVEIEAGDAYCYDEKQVREQKMRERDAAVKIFNILPPDQASEFMQLWEEFEKGASPEARAAMLLDRFQPVLLNCYTEGKSWQAHGIKRSQVLQRNLVMKKEAPLLWEQLLALLEDAVQKGYLKAE